MSKFKCKVCGAELEGPKMLLRRYPYCPVCAAPQFRTIRDDLFEAFQTASRVSARDAFDIVCDAVDASYQGQLIAELYDIAAPGAGA